MLRSHRSVERLLAKAAAMFQEARVPLHVIKDTGKLSWRVTDYWDRKPFKCILARLLVGVNGLRLYWVLELVLLVGRVMLAWWLVLL